MAIEQRKIDYILARYPEVQHKRTHFGIIRNEMVEHFGSGCAYDDYISLVTQDISVAVNAAVEDNPLYEVNGNRYVVWPFSFSIDEIDGIFADYSIYWNNLSQQQIMHKYKFKPEAWDAIKRAFRLNKYSHVVSPFTADNSTEEELDGRIDDAIETHHDTLVERLTYTHDRKFKKEAKAAFKAKGNLDYFTQRIQEAVQDYVPMYDGSFVEILERHSSNIEHVVISDIHIGKLETNKILNRLGEVADYCVSSPADTIYITCLGDLAEAFTWDGMHSNQIAFGTDHDFGMYWFNLLVRVSEIFERMIRFIVEKGWKKVIFTGITGNHDRMSIEKEKDQERVGGLVIYEMLKRWLDKVATVNYYNSHAATFEADWIHYIIHHWDGNMDRQQPEKVVITYWNLSAYNVILSGDKHTLRASEWRNFTNIKVPALAWVGSYDKSMNLHSETWFLVIRTNKHWTVDFEFKRLQK